MPTLVKLKEDRALVWGEMASIIERHDDFTDAPSEDIEKYERAEKALDELDGQIQLKDRAEAAQNSFREGADRYDFAVVDDGLDDVSAAEVRSDSQDEDPAYRAAFESWVRGGTVSEPLTRATNVAGTDNLGGFTVPALFWEKLVETQSAFGGLLQDVTTITTDTGADLPWATSDDTGNSGEWLGESGPVTEQEVSFGTNTLSAFVLSSQSVKVSQVLLQDSFAVTESFLSAKLGERMGRAIATAIAVGDNSGEPQGIMPAMAADTSQVFTGAVAATAAVTYDDLVDTEHKVDPAYRTERARWYFHDDTLKLLRKITDDNNNPIWQPSIQGGIAASLLGHDYRVVQDIVVPAADAYSILFGDLAAAYIWREVRGQNLVRLNELYAVNLQVGFFSWGRFDGGADDTNACSVFRHGAAS